MFGVPMVGPAVSSSSANWAAIDADDKCGAGMDSDIIVRALFFSQGINRSEYVVRAHGIEWPLRADTQIFLAFSARSLYNADGEGLPGMGAG